ncbi:MAG: hypothetical protein R3F31_15335 [Verrucomicrobiales bacterium]
MSRPRPYPGRLPCLLLLLPMLVAAGCARVDEFPTIAPPVRGLPPGYNAQVIKEAKATLLELEPKEKATRGRSAQTAELEELRRDLTKLRRRLDHPEFFTFATIADVPADLVWENGQSEPEVDDNAAKKGGKLTDFISFPPPCVIKSNSNNSFRSRHWDYIEIGLTGLHPIPGRSFPASPGVGGERGPPRRVTPSSRCHLL